MNQTGFTTESGGLSYLPRGWDFLTTTWAEQWIEIPPEMLGPGVDGFREKVSFTSAIPVSRIGNSDTVLERLADAEFGNPVPTRLVGFSNVSSRPIKLEGTGSMSGHYDLYVTLSSKIESTGQAVYESEDGITGLYSIDCLLSPVFELRPLHGGESIIVDTGEIPLPGFPLLLGKTQGAWSRYPSTSAAVSYSAGTTIFYTGEVYIPSYSDDGGELGACSKMQAEYVSPDFSMDGERVNFPLSREVFRIASE